MNGKMDKDAEFKSKLQAVLAKYDDVMKNKDPDFLLQYIQHCISTDAVISPKVYKPKKKESLAEKVADIFLKSVIVLFLIVGCGISVKGYIDDKVQQMEEAPNAAEMNYYLYTIRRWSVSLGLHKFDKIKELYDSTCFLKNPWYKETKNCHCNFNVRRFIVENPEVSQENFQKEISRMSDPFIILNGLEYPVSYHDIRKAYLDNKYDFSLGHNFVTAKKGSSIRGNLETLFAEDIPPQYSIVKWDLNFVEGVRHLRPLFPRPKFVPLNYEVNLQRHLYFFGEDAPGKRLIVTFAEGTPATVFYLQAWGRKQLILKTKGHCGCKHQLLYVNLNQGQLLYFNREMFDLFVGPASGYYKYAIGYTGSINIS